MIKQHSIAQIKDRLKTECSRLSRLELECYAKNFLNDNYSLQSKEEKQRRDEEFHEAFSDWESAKYLYLKFLGENNLAW